MQREGGCEGDMQIDKELTCMQSLYGVHGALPALLRLSIIIVLVKDLAMQSEGFTVCPEAPKSNIKS